MNDYGAAMRRSAQKIREAPGMTISVLVMLKRVISMCLLLVVAAGAMVLAWRLGQRPDPQVTRFLSSPTVAESLARRKSAAKSDETGETKPPLVVQAEAFASYLNPPEPPRRTPPPPRARITRVEVVPVAAPTISPKFRGVGISYHRSKPAESKALVWQPGGGLSWVTPGAELGHLVVRRINRDSVLYQDAAGMHEMAVELDATPTMPARKPHDRRPPEEDGHVATFAKMEVPRLREELPPLVEAEVNEPRMEESPVPADAKPQHRPALAHPTPGRRPRPIRPVAREG